MKYHFIEQNHHITLNYQVMLYKMTTLHQDIFEKRLLQIYPLFVERIDTCVRFDLHKHHCKSPIHGIVTLFNRTNFVKII